MPTFSFFLIGILAENGLKNICFDWNFCEAVQLELISLVGRIMKKASIF